jgi:DNA-binding NarL/FixJ family response regulator
MINVILAEGHNIVRIGIRALLEKDGGFNILAEGVNTTQALNYVKDKGIDADIVLVDMSAGGLAGIELVQSFKNISPNIKVIIFTALDNERGLINAFKVGANGYLLKNVSADELVFGIKHVQSGGRYICSELALRLLDKLIAMPEFVIGDSASNYDLNIKEQEVLMLIGEGLTNQEIAEKIFTSKRTIEGYRQSLMAKTGSRNTASLIKFAINNGLIN